MLGKKELFKKRWLLYLSYLFTYVAPLIIILEKLIIVNKPGSNVGFHSMAFLALLIYVLFLRKKARAKIEKMPNGFVKTITTGLSSLTPFVAVALLVHIIISGLQGFNVTMWVITGSMVIGVILEAIEAVINKDLIYDLELYEIAQKEVDLDEKKEQIRQERTNA